MIPTYRRPNQLRDAIESVRTQTFEDWELIVVDDNDPDTTERRQTAAVMEHFISVPRIRYVVHDHNLGGGAARNTGISLARGEFVAFLDDDDVWYPSKLEVQVRRLDREPEQVALVGCYIRKLGASGEVSFMRPTPADLLMGSLLEKNRLGSTSSVLCRKQALNEVGGFDVSLRSKQDIDLYVCLATRFRLACVQQVLMDYHEHAGEKIGKNLNGAVDAHLRFNAKHAHRLAQFPRANRYRQHATARLLSDAGRHREARSIYLSVWHTNRTDIAALFGALGIAPGLRFVGRSISRLRRRLRHAGAHRL